MKTLFGLFILTLLAVTGCSTSRPAAVAKDQGETVMVTYHVRAGQEAGFPAVLARSWEIYQQQHLVFVHPHLIVRDADAGGGTRFVETFTWIKAPESVPAMVTAAWTAEGSMCETRNGHPGIEGGAVQLIEGK